jgi:hypothetical protein
VCKASSSSLGLNSRRGLGGERAGLCVRPPPLPPQKKSRSGKMVPKAFSLVGERKEMNGNAEAQPHLFTGWQAKLGKTVLQGRTAAQCQAGKTRQNGLAGPHRSAAPNRRD